jgi:hypothetical protein
VGLLMARVKELGLFLPHRMSNVAARQLRSQLQRRRRRAQQAFSLGVSCLRIR